MRIISLLTILTLWASSIVRGHNESTFQLDSVVVTGTRTERTLSDVPIRTEVIRRSDIEAMSAMNLSEAVEFTSGLRVENNCQNCGFSQIRLLGLEGAYSQILFDGQPLMSSLAAVYGIEQIPARMIERIEVIKGGGSALYGPGSIAGVVNIISRAPRESGAEVETIVMDIDGADAFGVNALGNVVSPDGTSRFTLYGALSEQDAYDRTGDGFSDIVEREQQTLGLRLKQSIGQDADLALHYSRIHEDRRGGDQLDLPEFKVELAESIQSTMDIGGIGLSHAPSVTFDYQLTASFARNERDSYYGAARIPMPTASRKVSSTFSTPSSTTTSTAIPSPGAFSIT
jgi:outer membrane receptor for ferrienterochelin and colicins